MFRLPLLIPALLLMAFAVAMPAVAAQPAANRWEQMESIESELTEQTQVSVRSGYIYVSVSQPTQVKLFTILGQPVSSVTLKAGTSRLKVEARGIYILKIGTITRRITI